MKSKFIWVQEDASQTVIDVLREASDNPDFIRASLPEGWTKRKHPVCVVVNETTPRTGAAPRQNVRVMVRARDKNQTWRLMSMIDGFLTTPSIYRWGLSLRGSTGLINTPDSKMGGWICSAVYTIQTVRKAKFNG